MRFDLIEHVFPEFNILKNKTYNHTHRHAHTTRIGRVIERLENLENIIEWDLKDLYDGLNVEEQAGIRIALTCRDIPTLAEVSQRDYFQNLKKLYPSLNGATETAEHLIKKHRILFDCSLVDDWYDKRELEREATEIGTVSQLDAQLIYTCAMLDYGKTEYYTKYQWDKTFSLYHALKEELEWTDPEKREEYWKKAIVKKLLLSPEQLTILDSAPQTFLHSRYVSASDALTKTMKCLEIAQKKWEPQITITRTHDNTIRIVVSAPYNNNLPAIITGTCLESDVAIDDAEIHIFGSEQPLAVLFLEGRFSIPWVTNAGKEYTIAQLDKNLHGKIPNWKITGRDPQEILKLSGPKYLLEKTKKTGNYKLMVTAEKNTPWFLYALTRIIAESDVRILSTSVYTHPRNHGSSPLIEDIFILGTTNIENLKRTLGIE